jgi:hypothetical protein
VVRAGVTGGTGSLTEGYFLFSRDPRGRVKTPVLSLLRHYHEAPWEDTAAAFGVSGCLIRSSARGFGYLLMPDSSLMSARFLADSNVSDNVPDLRLGRRSGYYAYDTANGRFLFTAPPDSELVKACRYGEDERSSN